MLFRTLIFNCLGSIILSAAIPTPAQGNSSNFLKINTYEDYQRLSLIKDKIELLALIEDQLLPLTDDEILDSKMNDLHLWYEGIKEMQKSYEKVRSSLKKHSSANDPDIKALYQGAINFLDNQGKILELIAQAIENTPEAESVDDLPAVDIGGISLWAFKIKAAYQTKKFRNSMEKVSNEISSYADALGITED